MMLDPSESVRVSFTRARAQLAQLPQTSFYGRLARKFGLGGSRA